MAEIRPFRALRYDPAKVKLEDVVTQPYDKITPEMQRTYYERDPANFIRFELPMGESDPYASAKAFFGEMRRRGAIQLEDRPAMYVYEQEPPDKGGASRARRALIALGRLHDYSDKVIFRHEETLTGPKRDREQLLKTARVQSGLLFMLYDDPECPVEALRPKEQIVGDFVDDIGIRQRLWRVADPQVPGLEHRFQGLPLFIADGHHRYETALSLRRSREGKYAEDFAMMALVNMQSKGLKVLATHRTIFGIENERFAGGLRRLISDLHATTSMKPPQPAQGEDASRFVCVVATSDGGAWKIDIAREELQQRFPSRSCELDVEALHVLLEEYFGITHADAAAQRHIRYHRHDADALRDVISDGAQAAFLIRPVTVDKIRERSLRGALMPQKSTDFYPKMNSGLTLYSWDESFADPTKAKPARVGNSKEI